MENKVNTTDYHSEIVKLDIFYIGKPSEKKQHFQNLQIAVNDGIANKIDRREERRMVRKEKLAQKRKKLNSDQFALFFYFQLHPSGSEYKIIQKPERIDYSVNEIRIDTQLKGFYFGTEKGLNIAIEVFYKSQGVNSLNEKIAFHSDFQNKEPKVKEYNE